MPVETDDVDLVLGPIYSPQTDGKKEPSTVQAAALISSGYRNRTLSNSFFKCLQLIYTRPITDRRLHSLNKTRFPPLFFDLPAWGRGILIMRSPVPRLIYAEYSGLTGRPKGWLEWSIGTRFVRENPFTNGRQLLSNISVLNIRQRSSPRAYSTCLWMYVIRSSKGRPTSNL